ncbi:MAG TPA: hypothetical protein VI953_04420 [Candidatus Paceibacterota bacterium]
MENERINNTKDELSPLRTYKQDVAAGLGTEGTSIASIAMQEQKKREEESLSGEKDSRLSKRLVVIIAALVIIGAMVLSFVVFLWQRPPAVVVFPSDTLPAPLLYAETQERFVVSGKTSATLYKDVAAKLSGASFASGSINEVILTKASTTPLSAQEFSTALDLGIPDKLVRFVDKKFMLGSYSFRITRGFVVLQPFSYGSVLSELLAWEKDMPGELVPLLTGKELPATVGSWQDTVIRNIDVRVLKNTSGTTLLLYAFLPARSSDGTQLLIIAPDEELFAELLLRSQSPRPVIQ